MSIVTSPVPPASGKFERDLGVAGPPPSPSPSVVIQLPPTLAAQPLPGAIVARRFSFGQWWNPESAKGWAGSLTLHVLLLVSLACWYFAPRIVRTTEIDSTLSGSLNGLPEGDQLDGGSNGSPISLAGELDALDKSADKEQPQVKTPSQPDAPQINMANESVRLLEAEPLPVAHDTRRGGRRLGMGNAGNWVRAAATDSAWLVLETAAKRFEALPSRSAILNSP